MSVQSTGRFATSKIQFFVRAARCDFSRLVRAERLSYPSWQAHIVFELEGVFRNVEEHGHGFPEGVLHPATKMAASPSFYEWLTKQTTQRTPLGGLARDVARDSAFPKDVASLEALLEYVRTSPKGSAQAVAVARSAFRAFARSQAPAPR